MMGIKVTIAVIAILMSVYGYSNAYASHGTDTASCEGDGLYDGKNNQFSQELYEMCGDTYYDSFIDGCMDADNSREVCEQATDAE